MGAQPPRRANLAATWALFVGVFLLTAGNGLQFTTVGVRSTIEEFNSVAIGVMTASYYVGFLAGAVFTYRSLGRVGHLRVFAALASTGSASVLLHTLFVSPLSWSLMRVATGFCLAGLFIVIESWINVQATNATRGVLMSTDMVTVLGGRAAGQALLNVGDPGGFDLFVMSSVMVSMALVPMMMSATSAPPVIVPERMRFAELRSVAPTGVVTIFVGGWTTAVLGGLSAVYATRVGMDTGQVSLFVGSLIVGAAVFQLPIGSLSDRIRRRLVILGISAGAIVLLLALAAAPATGWVPIVLIGLVGGFTYPMYGHGVALTNDWIPDEKRCCLDVADDREWCGGDHRTDRGVDRDGRGSVAALREPGGTPCHLRVLVGDPHRGPRPQAGRRAVPLRSDRRPGHGVCPPAQTRRPRD